MSDKITKKQEEEIVSIEQAFSKESKVIQVPDEEIRMIKTWLPYYEAQMGPLEEFEEEVSNYE